MENSLVIIGEHVVEIVYGGTNLLGLISVKLWSNWDIVLPLRCGSQLDILELQVHTWNVRRNKAWRDICSQNMTHSVVI